MKALFEGPFGRRAQRRLKSELVIWLTSVDLGGRPQPRPVWFHWNGADLLIYSQPKTGKVRQIAAQPKVAVHFNADEQGDDVVVLLGEARLADRVPPDRLKSYLRKYRKGIAGLEMTPQSFMAEYSVPILVRPTALRGF